MQLYDVIGGYTLDVHYGRHKVVRGTYTVRFHGTFSVVQYGFGSLFSIRVSAHLVSHLESNRFDQFQEFYV